MQFTHLKTLRTEAQIAFGRVNVKYAGGESDYPSFRKNAKARFWIKVVLSGLTFALSCWILASGKFVDDSASRQGAIGWIGVLIGYWLVPD
jgi:hypothetical protein